MKLQCYKVLICIIAVYPKVSPAVSITRLASIKALNSCPRLARSTANSHGYPALPQSWLHKSWWDGWIESGLKPPGIKRICRNVKHQSWATPAFLFASRRTWLEPGKPRREWGVQSRNESPLPGFLGEGPRGPGWRPAGLQGKRWSTSKGQQGEAWGGVWHADSRAASIKQPVV